MFDVPLSGAAFNSDYLAKAAAQRRNDQRYELAKAALVELISGPRDYALSTLPERALWLADNLLARIDGVEGCHDGDLQT